jgi:hypothetical protein
MKHAGRAMRDSGGAIVGLSKPLLLRWRMKAVHTKKQSVLIL